MPISDAAEALLRLHFADAGPPVNDQNREVYRELARAGLMEPRHTFTHGRESHYRVTLAGADYFRAANPVASPGGSAASPR